MSKSTPTPEPTTPKEGLRFIQIQVGQWTMSDDGIEARAGFSVIGLANNGRVYQYKKSGVDAWVPFTHRFFDVIDE